MYIRAVAGDFEQIYDNGMHLGRPISLPPGAGRNPGLSFAPALSVRISNRARNPAGGRATSGWETRDRSAPITVARRLEFRMGIQFNRRTAGREFPHPAAILAAFGPVRAVV